MRIFLKILKSDDVISNVKIDSFSSLKEAMELMERKLLIESMRNADSTEDMAKMLKIDRSTVIRKLQKHKIKARF